MKRQISGVAVCPPVAPEDERSEEIYDPAHPFICGEDETRTRPQQREKDQNR